MQIQYRKTPRWQSILASICTLGLARLLLRRMLRLRPDAMDEQGLLLANGMRIEWGQCDEITNACTTGVDAEVERLVLLVNGQHVPLHFDQMIDGEQVREFFWSRLPGRLAEQNEESKVAIQPERTS